MLEVAAYLTLACGFALWVRAHRLEKREGRAAATRAWGNAMVVMLAAAILFFVS